MQRGAVATSLLLLMSMSTLALDVEWEDDAVKFIHDRRRLDGTAIERSDNVGRLLDKYMTEGMRDVIGWFDYQALLVLRVLSAHQLAHGVDGGVAEIGVHHGKSFAALCLLNRDAEEASAGGGVHRALAVDVFDDQLLNTDGSGEGDLETFRATLLAWCGEDSVAPHRLSILQQDSRTLTSSQVIAESGGVQPRIFSIDGSHTAEHTESDMLTAAESICEGGIIMVDDYFAEGWPGVSEGVQAFMIKQRSASSKQGRGSDRAIVPFFVGFNKVLFASEDFSGTYQDALMSGQNVIGDGTMKVKMQQMFGYPVVLMTEEGGRSGFARNSKAVSLYNQPALDAAGGRRGLNKFGVNTAYHIASPAQDTFAPCS